MSPRLGIMVLPRLGRLGIMVLPTLGRLGIMVLPRLGRLGIMVLPRLGRLGIMVLPRLGRLGVMVRAAGQKQSDDIAPRRNNRRSIFIRFASLQADAQTVVVGVYAIFLQEAVGWLTSGGERQRPTGVNMSHKLVKLLAGLAFPS